MEDHNEYVEEIIEDNEEIVDDITGIDPTNLVVYSRDWTVETIVNQIQKGNIDLNPKFQRRNAWNDIKRSRLIESMIMNYPIPEIVLAEDPKKKKSFIVIDGKQRLLTVAGFIHPDQFQYWGTEKLRQLKVRTGLNGLSFQDFIDGTNEDLLREFENSEIRCTIISNISDTDILYDIFYRLNTGSTPLSTQELRQVLNKGEFADYLIEITNKIQPIHEILNLSEPDKRLRDVEIILRYFNFQLFPNDYGGNLKSFLDSKMELITTQWEGRKAEIEELYGRFNDSISKLIRLFDEPKKVGRKYNGPKYETRFNKVLFEVQMYYMDRISIDEIDANKPQYIEAFQDLLVNDLEFRGSIESTTKSVEQYEIRFRAYQILLADIFGLEFEGLPVTNN